MEVVVAADMSRADVYLRHCHADVRAHHHLAARDPITANVDLCEGDTLVRQEPLGGDAVGAVAGGVNLDLGHVRSQLARTVYGFVTRLPLRARPVRNRG